MLLKDIIEKGFVDNDKSYCIDANYFKGGNLKSYFEKHRRQLVFKQKYSENTSSLKRMLKSTKAFDEKANCMTATMYKGMASNGVTNVIQDCVFRMLTPLEYGQLYIRD